MLFAAHMGWVDRDHALRVGGQYARRATLFLGGIAVAHYCAGRLAEAVHYSQEILRLRPRFQGAQRMYCASLAQAGRVEEARKFLGTVRLEQPQLSLDRIRKSVPYQTPGLMEQFLDGMRKAGLT
ncbi:MAG: tetratricopeptide repeat protein [Bradyrhizobium sp.]